MNMDRGSLSYFYTIARLDGLYSSRPISLRRRINRIYLVKVRIRWKTSLEPFHLPNHYTFSKTTMTMGLPEPKSAVAPALTFFSTVEAVEATCFYAPQPPPPCINTLCVNNANMIASYDIDSRTSCVASGASRSSTCHKYSLT